MAVTKTELQNGRIYHNTNATYALPNDKPEHSRLEGQAEQFRAMMGNRVLHSPLRAPSVEKALDIGCGTGIVSHEIASIFPKAQVYGLDLSPVPEVRAKLPNIEYIQGQFDEMASPDKPDPRFQAASFDFIFSRLLVVGMRDWKQYVERCAALAKPGGWIEMHDIDLTFNRVPNNVDPSLLAHLHSHTVALSNGQLEYHPGDDLAVQDEWVTTFHKIADVKGMDLRCGRNLPRLFAEAGLEDITVRRYCYPTGLWDGMTDVERNVARWHHETMGKHFPVMLRKMAEGQNQVTKEEVEKAATGARIVNENWKSSGKFNWIYVVCGRKA